MGLFGSIVGLLKFVFKFIFVTIIIGVIIGLLPGLPPHDMQFTAFDLPKNQELSFNNQFKNVERLFEGEIHGPESLVYHKGVLYTGIHGGQVVRIVNDKILPFVKFGKPCGGFYDEHVCGRPLGITVDKHDNLYVADAYYGLFKVNITSKAVKQLVSPDTVIEGRNPKLFNSVVVASDGTIYWTDSDSNVQLHDGAYSFLADGTGRLIKYDPVTETNTVLIDRIRFANGIAISPDESFIIVAESFSYRLLRYFLKGPRKGTWNVFVDGLPGSPDNLKVDSKGNFYVPLVIPRNEESTSLLIHNLHKFPLVRKSLARTLALLELIFQYAKPVCPKLFCEKAIHMVGHFEGMVVLLPKGSQQFSLVILNKDGNIASSYHSLDGRLSGICDVEPVGDYLYLGSPFNHFLGRVKLPSEFKFVL